MPFPLFLIQLIHQSFIEKWAKIHYRLCNLILSRRVAQSWNNFARRAFKRFAGARPVWLISREEQIETRKVFSHDHRRQTNRR